MLTRLISRLVRATNTQNQHRKFNLFLLRASFSLPLLIVAAITFSTVAHSLTELSLEERKNGAALIAGNLAERIERVLDVGVEFAAHPEIREVVLKGNWKDALLGLEIMTSMINDPFVDRVFLADPSGKLMVGFPETGTEGQDFSYRDWYRGAMNTGRPYLSEVYQRTIEPKYHVVAIAIPIADEHNQTAAIMVLQVRAEHFLEWIRTVDVGPQGFVYVVDQRGHVVAHPMYPFQNAVADLSHMGAVKSVVGGAQGVDVTEDTIEGVESVVVYEPLAKFGWGVIVQQPTEQAFASRDGILTILAALFILVFLLNTFFAYVVYRLLGECQEKCRGD